MSDAIAFALLSTVASKPTTKNVMRMPISSRVSRAIGRNFGKYDGRSTHRWSPRIFMYDQRSSTSSEMLHIGRSDMGGGGFAGHEKRRERGGLAIRKPDGLVEIERAALDLRRVDDKDVGERGAGRRQRRRAVVERRDREHVARARDAKLDNVVALEVRVHALERGQEGGAHLVVRRLPERIV